MPKNPDDQQEFETVARRGRRAGDPANKREYRYVMRMHPDLAEVLGLMADEAGLSRALFVERILISFVNMDPRVKLDNVGRRTNPRAQSVPPLLGSVASFGQAWERGFGTLRPHATGDEVHRQNDGYVDDHGRDEFGRPPPPRPPVDAEGFIKRNIRTNRGAKPKKK